MLVKRFNAVQTAFVFLRKTRRKRYFAGAAIGLWSGRYILKTTAKSRDRKRRLSDEMQFGGDKQRMNDKMKFRDGMRRLNDITQFGDSKQSLNDGTQLQRRQINFWGGK